VTRSIEARHPARRWLALIVAGLCGLIGYYGPWIPHRAVGLIVLGLDLAEYVKFLPQVAGGEIVLRRELFYLPLIAASAGSALIASRDGLPRWARWLLALAAIPAALAMLPPAWSPAVLAQPEFRLQVVAIGACLALIAMIPLLQRLPDRIVLGCVALLALLAAIVPAWGFLRVLAPIESLYGHAIKPGWGFWTSLLGFGAAAVIAIAEMLRPRS